MEKRCTHLTGDKDTPFGGGPICDEDGTFERITHRSAMRCCRSVSVRLFGSRLLARPRGLSETGHQEGILSSSEILRESHMQLLDRGDSDELHACHTGQLL